MKLLYEYLQEYASSLKDKVAIKDENGEYTYYQLNKKSDNIASYLTKISSKQDVIGVYIPYTKEVLLGAFSIFKAGCIYLPLDKDYPISRLNYMMENSSCKIVLTLKKFYKKHPLDTNCKIVFLDDEYSDTDFTPVKTNDDDIAFILYTSGTTGNPKGVLHTNIMLTSFYKWRENLGEGQFNINSNIGVLTGFTFIGTNDFVFSSILKGSSLYLSNEAQKKDLNQLVQFIQDNKLTHIFLPSSLASILVEYIDTKDLHIFAAGEKLRNYKPINPNSNVYNAYGCTEVCGIFSIKVKGNETNMPLGYLAKDTLALLVDENLKEVDKGEVGELLVSNSRMSHSYLNLEKLNKEKWITINNKIYFRTGDRIVLKDDNKYYYVGRIDNMVKIRGFRVETGEVENQIIKACKKLNIDVKTCVVVLKNIQDIDRLVCYYESKNKVNEELIKQEISKYLGDYMLPDLYNNIEKLPRNFNGKIDRSKLPEPILEKFDSSKVENAAESKFIQIFSSTYNIKVVDLDRRFTDYGLSSIQAMMFSSKLIENGINISGSKLLNSPSLRELINSSSIEYIKFFSKEELEKVTVYFNNLDLKIEEFIPFNKRQNNLALEMLINVDMLTLNKVIFLQIDSLINKDILQNIIDKIVLENREFRENIVYKDVQTRLIAITSRKIKINYIETDNESVLAEEYDNLVNQRIDPQKDSLFSITLINCNNQSYIYLYTHKFIYSRILIRKCIKEMFLELLNTYKEDNSLNDWIEMMSLEIPSISKEEEEESKLILPTKKEDIEDIHIFNPTSTKRKIFFVHTGNSGSEAYHSLATRLEDSYSFCVIEPYNLYHIDSATYGIKNIASRYIQTIKKYQPKGPYILGGWCYGGVVAHQMAYQLEQEGEKVELLIMLDSHAITKKEWKKDFTIANENMDREYFMNSPLFEDIRQQGMLEAMILNSQHVFLDLKNHKPSLYKGNVLYFKPNTIPAGLNSRTKIYWEEVNKSKAGNFENYCLKDKLQIYITPDEHDNMMNKSTLDIIVPLLKNKLEK